MKVTKVSNSPISPILLLPAGRLRTKVSSYVWPTESSRSAEVLVRLTTSTFHEFFSNSNSCNISFVLVCQSGKMGS